MGFFDDRTYNPLASVDDGLAEKSSLTYDYDEAYLYTISDARTIRRLDRNGDQVGSDISFPVGDDTEGIVYLGTGHADGNFAVLEEGEGTAPNDKPRIYIFSMDAETTSIDPGDITTYDCDDVATFPGEGAEGIAYDPTLDKFYLGVQATGEDEGGLWEVTLGAAPATTASRLFYWYDALVFTGEIPGTAFVGDLELNRSLPDGGDENLFVLVNDDSDPDGQKVVEMDRAGNIVSVLAHGISGKTEGIAFDTTAEYELYLVGEQADPNWWKFSTRSIVELLGWQAAGARYDDTNTDYATSTPTFADPSFDPDSPPGGGSAFKTGQGTLYYGGITGLHGDTALNTAMASSLVSYYAIWDIVVANAMETVNLEFNADDGFLLLVDGVEEYSYNYSGGLDHGATAPSAIGGSDEGDKHGPVALDAAKFTAGSHRVAVLVKNQSTGSSDLGFDLRISGVEVAAEPEPETVSIMRTGVARLRLVRAATAALKPVRSASARLRRVRSATARL